MATRDLEKLKEWEGRETVSRERLGREKLSEVCAMFDLDASVLLAEQSVPPLWHWFFLNPPVAQKNIGSDGHPQLGGFLPPFDFPRRMWGAGSVDFHERLEVDLIAEKRSTIRSVDIVEARSGTLGRVRIEHVVSQRGVDCIRETQELIYREADTGAGANYRGQNSSLPAEFKRKADSSESLLFRFSALTSNVHRIHYDQPYATLQEGYPGLVVHGPLTAMRLARLATEVQEASLASFSFRATSPLFVGEGHALCAAWQGEELHLWAEQPSGGTAMRAEARFHSGN